MDKVQLSPSENDPIEKLFIRAFHCQSMLMAPRVLCIFFQGKLPYNCKIASQGPMAFQTRLEWSDPLGRALAHCCFIFSTMSTYNL